MSVQSPIPLVLIPALLCDEAMYRVVIDGLGSLVAAQTHVAVRPTMAESVAEILERAPARFVLGGSSYGGTVAIEAALAAPERIVGLWLTGCDPGAPNRDATLGLAAMLENSTEAAVDHLASVVVRPQATAAAATFRAMAGRIGGPAAAAQARALAGRDSAWERLEELSMPTLVLWGEDDAAIPVAVGRRMTAALPSARFHAIRECGHLPTLERADDVAVIVGEWMEQVLGT